MISTEGQNNQQWGLLAEKNIDQKWGALQYGHPE